MRNRFNTNQLAQELWMQFDEARLSMIIPRELRGGVINCQIAGFDNWAKNLFLSAFPDGRYRSLRFSEKSENPEVIIGIFGKRDISITDKYTILDYKQQHGAFFPVILFQDKFYEIPFHEEWGYVPHIESLSKEADFPALPLKESDFKEDTSIFGPYADKIAFIARLFRARKAVIDWKSQLKFLSVESGANGQSAFKSYLDKILERKLIESKERLQILDDQLIGKMYSQVVSSYKENTSQIIREAQVKKYKLKSIPPQLKGLGLEALGLANKIGSLMRNLESYDGFDSTFISQLGEMKHYLDFATDVSLIGPFSAGKTTFVNALLDLKLKTSSKHNTAVLTSVEYVPEGQPSTLYFSYTNKYSFRLFSPDFDHPKLALYSPCDGHIIDIHNYNTQYIIILVDKNDQNRIIPLSIGKRELRPDLLKAYQQGVFKTKKLRVKKDTPLTKGLTIDQLVRKKSTTSRFFCFGRPEIKEIINQIKKGSFSKLELLLYNNREEIETLENPAEIIQILSSLSTIAPDYPGSGEYYQEDFHSGHLFLHYYQAELYATLSPQHKLPKQITTEEEHRFGVLEEPSCYLFVEKTELVAHNPFLQLANIVDTPGLGSITSRHDLITERHLRETKGVIVVLIKINYSIEKYEFWNLLALIHCLFKYENRPTDNLFFLCNWEEGLFGQAEGEAKLRQVEGYLKEFGFPTDQFYVGDLDAWGREGVALEMFKGYPSLAAFRNSLDKKTTRLGSGAKLKLLQEDMQNLLRNQYKKDQQALDNMEEGSELVVRQNILDDYNAQLSDIRGISLDKNIREEEENLFYETYRDCKSIIENVSTGNDWDDAKRRLLDLAEIMNNAFRSPVYFTHISAQIQKVKSAGNNFGYQIPINLSSYQFGSCGQISKESFRSKIDNAKTSWPSRWGRFTKWLQGERNSTLDGIRRTVRSFISGEIDRMEKKYKQQADRGEKWFEKNKLDARNTIHASIETLTKGEEDKIEKLEKRITYLEEEVFPLWDNLSRQIDKINAI